MHPEEVASVLDIPVVDAECQRPALGGMSASQIRSVYPAPGTTLQHTRSRERGLPSTLIQTRAVGETRPKVIGLGQRGRKEVTFTRPVRPDVIVGVDNLSGLTRFRAARRVHGRRGIDIRQFKPVTLAKLPVVDVTERRGDLHRTAKKADRTHWSLEPKKPSDSNDGIEF